MTEITNSTFVEFTLENRPDFRVSEQWTVWSVNGHRYLGTVRWKGEWRKYVFEPTTESQLNADHVREVAEFLERETAARHSKGRRAGTASAAAAGKGSA